jgi:hypothetical protein
VGGACEVVQSPGRDHTEPEFRVSLDAEDDRSNVILTLYVGTVPGGRDVVSGKELGGFSTALTEVRNTVCVHYSSTICWWYKCLMIL